MNKEYTEGKVNQLLKEYYRKLVQEYKKEFKKNEVYKMDIVLLRNNKVNYKFSEEDKDIYLKHQKLIENEKNKLMIKVILIVGIVFFILFYSMKYITKSLKV